MGRNCPRPTCNTVIPAMIGRFGEGGGGGCGMGKGVEEGREGGRAWDGEEIGGGRGRERGGAEGNRREREGEGAEVDVVGWIGGGGRREEGR